MTYEEKVHAFGLRWLMNNSASVARLREFDPARYITLETSVDGYGCSCDYDYDTTYELVVPHINGSTFRVDLGTMEFADVLRQVIEAEPVEVSGIADLVMAGQAQQIVDLQAETKELRAAKAKAEGALRVLENGLSQQQNLWTYLRNLYRDLGDYTDGSTGLSTAELDELIAFLYRELDLWFNRDQDDRVTMKLNVGRSA